MAILKFRTVLKETLVYASRAGGDRKRGHFVFRYSLFGFYICFFSSLSHVCAWPDDLSTAVLAPSGFAQGFRQMVISYTILPESAANFCTARNGELSRSSAI